MKFYCVFCNNRKKIDKFIKYNKIKNKYVIDVKKIINETNCDYDDKMLLKIIIFNKIQNAIKKKKDIFYIPYIDYDFNIEKILNIKSIINNNDMNLLIFYDEIKKRHDLINDIYNNISRFSNTYIIENY